MTGLSQLSPNWGRASASAATLTLSSSLEGLVDEDFTVLILNDEVQLGVT